MSLAALFSAPRAPAAPAGGPGSGPHPGAGSLTAPDGDFIDWWFSPWHYALDGAVDATAGPVAMHDDLARRDGYRLWCQRAGIAADLPQQGDAAWQALAETDGAALLATARLFGGLLAARQQQTGALAELAPAQRAWCLRTAALQPLVSHGAPLYQPATSLAVRGLTELAYHLHSTAPGVWPRQALALPTETRQPVDQLLQALHEQAPEAAAPAGATRVLRCWRMCRDRVYDGADVDADTDADT